MRDFEFILPNCGSPSRWSVQPRDLEHGFVADALFDGRRLRALTVVDKYTRECLPIEVGQSLKVDDVVNALATVFDIGRSRLSAFSGNAQREFSLKGMHRWADENHGYPGTGLVLARTDATSTPLSMKSG
ncbi:MAG TPA: hypothetical protein VNE58_03285 [Casimicrobiaceae bacterium]|nr:hypothetical protein [Casimicrobiaceae bacterium]